MPNEPQPNAPLGHPTEDEIVAFLKGPSAFAEPAAKVDVIETHCARVFLAGAKALKVKKPVRLPFLDFSTLELRRRALAREFEINAPHAPEIYLGLTPIVRKDDGGLEIGGKGPAVEWALEMRRFNQEDLLSAVAAKGHFAPDISRSLAEMVARYHLDAPPAARIDGAVSVAKTLRQLLSEIDDAGNVLASGARTTVRANAEAAYARIADLLGKRAAGTAFRRCHGDLHLGNIVMIAGRPVPFDALEFDEELATIDVLYDLAFLLMDLDARGDRAAANVVLNAYVGAAPLRTEIEGLACLPLYLAMRALVRAVVALARARQQEKSKRHVHEAEAERLVALANAYLRPPPPRLVAVGGFSGTGKSTLAGSLAPDIGPAPGALHLRSDVERKRLFGVDELARLTPEHYSQSASDEVYRILFNKAERTLAAGHGAVVDAVFIKPEERRELEAVARRAGAAFTGLWLEAPAETLLERVGARRGDASDADSAVVRAQLARPVGAMTWTRIDARGGREATRAAAAAKLFTT